MTRRAQWLVVAGLLLGTTAAGCDGCGGDAAGAGAANTNPALRLGPLPEDVPQPGAIYQTAYDAALAEITTDNAPERLRQIERQVERELRELR